MSKENQRRLIQSNTIIIAHRAFTAYLGYDNIETKLYVPIFGNRRPPIVLKNVMLIGTNIIYLKKLELNTLEFTTKHRISMD